VVFGLELFGPERPQPAYRLNEVDELLSLSCHRVGKHRGAQIAGYGASSTVP
jgi:hypothetical protein